MLILVDNKILQFVADYFIPNYLPKNCLSYRYSEINHFVDLLWGNLFLDNHETRSKYQINVAANCFAYTTDLSFNHGFGKQ